MNVTTWYGNWQFWADYPNQKVVFDGRTRTIFVSEGVTELDIRTDVYSAWKEWVFMSPETPTPAIWPYAITAIGGEQITDTTNVGTTYFLENGWRIQPFSSTTPYVLTVIGNIYTREPGQNPFLFAEGASVSLTRSNIVELVSVNGGTGSDPGELALAVWQSDTRTLTSAAPPTAQQIRSEIDANSTKLVEIQQAVEEVPQNVWTTPTTITLQPGTFGHFILNKLLTVAKFLGLK